MDSGQKNFEQSLGQPPLGFDNFPLKIANFNFFHFG